MLRLVPSQRHVLDRREEEAEANREDAMADAFQREARAAAAEITKDPFQTSSETLVRLRCARLACVACVLAQLWCCPDANLASRRLPPHRSLLTVVSIVSIRCPHSCNFCAPLACHHLRRLTSSNETVCWRITTTRRTTVRWQRQPRVSADGLAQKRLPRRAFSEVLCLLPPLRHNRRDGER
jgi:hypothetical protein